MLDLVETVQKINTLGDVIDELTEKTSEFVETVETLMVKNGISTLLNGKYVIQEVRANCGSTTDLYMTISGDYYRDSCLVLIGCRGLSATRAENFFWGDFNAPFNRPTIEDIQTLINDIPEILAELAGYSEIAEKIEQIPRLNQAD